jgi:hypothetical protein
VVRAPLLLVLLVWVGCESAEHRALTSRIGDRAGSRVVSNVVEAPAGASWIRARIQTQAYRSESKDHAFRKRWAVWTDLLVEYAADEYASTRLVTFGEGEARADELVEQAHRTYQLRAAGPDDVETSLDGKTWTRMRVPHPVLRPAD